MKRITFFILSIFCFIACNNEVEIEKPEAPVSQIELIFPDIEDVKVYSTATVNECRIETLWVFAFRGGTKQWAEQINVSNITKNGQAAQLLPQLSDVHKPGVGDIIVCIANVAISSTDTSGITSLNSINAHPALLLNKQKYFIGGEALPMYGELTWSVPMGNYSCVMKRAVAKIQVQMGTNVSDMTSKFSADSVTFRIYNFAEQGYLQPRPTTAGRPITTALPTQAFNLMQNRNDASESKTNAYIYEYRSSINSIADTINNIGISTFNANRQYIILEKDNSPSANTFYRLDFYNSNSSEFLDTKRNHHYIFTISKVRSEGYTTMQQARDNPGSNIEYIVYVSEDSKATSNGQYAIVSSIDTIKIPASGPFSGVVGNVRYQPGATMTTSIVTSVNNMTTTGANFGVLSPAAANSLDIIGPSYDRVNIQINALAAFTTGSITFKLGNITHTIPVVRE